MSKEENPSSSRLLVLTSHFQTAMASEKEAALAAAPSDSPTMSSSCSPLSLSLSSVISFLFCLFLLYMYRYTNRNRFSWFLIIYRFDKIINKQIPANIVYEDEQVVFCSFNPFFLCHLFCIFDNVFYGECGPSAGFCYFFPWKLNVIYFLLI